MIINSKNPSAVEDQEIPSQCEFRLLGCFIVDKMSLKKR